MKITSPNSYPFEPLSGKKPLEVLLDGLSYFGERNYALSAGTLLGLERDGDFIPQDTDIDIEVIGAEEVTLPDYYLPIRFVDDDKPMQRAYLHKPTNIIFDIMHYYPDGDEVYNRSEKGYIRRSKRFSEPFGQKTYMGHLFSVPNDIDAYLTEWYGDWRTPRQEKTKWIK